MDKIIEITVDENMYALFCATLNYKKDNMNDTFNSFIGQYVSDILKNMVDDGVLVAKSPSQDKSNECYGMANRKIPRWAVAPHQYNHKIIRAYFTAAEATGRATLAIMEQLCSDKNNAALYVPTFRTNYAQMKLDSPKSHGKVFIDDGETVTIWEGVNNTLEKYKHHFTL